MLDRKIIEKRAFELHLYEHPDIHVVIKKHKLIYLNSQIQQVAKELVLECYANSYRPPPKDVFVEPELISWVKGKHIQFD